MSGDINGEKKIFGPKIERMNIPGAMQLPGKKGRFQRMAIRKPMSEKGMMRLRRWGWVKPKKRRQTDPEGESDVTCIQWESPDENKRSGYETMGRKKRFKIVLFC